MKRLTLLFLVVGFTACQKKPPHTEPSTVCRASPVWLDGALSTDDQTVLGDTGDEGVTTTAYACPTRNRINDLAGCVAFSDTGVHDSVVVTFKTGSIEYQLGPSRGYKAYQIRLDYTCH